MASAHPKSRLSWLGVILSLTGASMASGCVGLPKQNPFALGGVDANSSIAADVEAASHAPGPYPKIGKIPTTPTDVRSTAAWKSAVDAELQAKQQLEGQAAAIPFTLKNTEAFADATRARISPELATAAPADAQAQAEAFAEAERARATPPPKPN